MCQSVSKHPLGSANFDESIDAALHLFRPRLGAAKTTPGDFGGKVGIRLGAWRVGRTHLHPDARGTLRHHRVAKADDPSKTAQLRAGASNSKVTRVLGIDASLQHLIGHLRGEPGVPQHDRNDRATPASGCRELGCTQERGPFDVGSQAS